MAAPGAPVAPVAPCSPTVPAGPCGPRGPSQLVRVCVVLQPATTSAITANNHNPRLIFFTSSYGESPCAAGVVPFQLPRPRHSFVGNCFICSAVLRLLPLPRSWERLHPWQTHCACRPHVGDEALDQLGPRPARREDSHGRNDQDRSRPSSLGLPFRWNYAPLVPWRGCKDRSTQPGSWRDEDSALSKRVVGPDAAKRLQRSHRRALHEISERLRQVGWRCRCTIPGVDGSFDGREDAREALMKGAGVASRPTTWCPRPGCLTDVGPGTAGIGCPSGSRVPGHRGRR